MADDSMSDDLGEDVELEATPRKKGMAGKKIILLFVLPLLLIGIGGVAVFASGILDSLTGGGEQSGEQKQGKVGTFYHDLPTILVNLNSSEGQGGFLKLTVSLEVETEGAKERIKTVTPRIVDSFQVYLRELRVSDLEGSAGLQRLREELLLRVNNTVEGAKVKDVLFKEMLVQ
jgi:flagellar FliL protein